MLIDFILHIDKHLDSIVSNYGTFSYAVLFFIVFCETGLIITPFLPGDSLLFAAGAISARGSLNPFLLAGLLWCAATLGNTVNYFVGKKAGPLILEKLNGRIIKQKHLDKTAAYFEKYGSKTIVLAQFMPIIRTISPFSAGIGKMNYRTFITYNLLGATLWIGCFVTAGYLFGETPIVKKNFTLVIMAIIGISILPALIEVIRAKRRKKSN